MDRETSLFLIAETEADYAEASCREIIGNTSIDNLDSRKLHSAARKLNAEDGIGTTYAMRLLAYHLAVSNGLIVEATEGVFPHVLGEIASRITEPEIAAVTMALSSEAVLSRWNLATVRRELNKYKKREKRKSKAVTFAAASERLAFASAILGGEVSPDKIEKADKETLVAVAAALDTVSAYCRHTAGGKDEISHD